MNAFMSPRFSADPMATSAPIIKPSSTMPAPAPKQNAFAAKAAAPMPASSPAQNPFAISQPASPGPLANAFKGFATGLLGVDKINAMDDRYKAQDAEEGKKKLAMLQQFRAMPVDQRMAALPQLSQAIGKEIPPDTMSDQAIDAQVAMMSGQLGIAPATPEAARYQGMGLGDGGVGVLNQTTGKMEVVREPTVAPPKEADPIKWDTVTDASGKMWRVNPYDGSKEPLGLTGRVPGEGGAGGVSGAFRTMTPEEVRMRGYSPGTVVQVDGRGKEYVNARPSTAQTGQPTESERAAGLHTQVSLNGLRTIMSMEGGGYNRAGMLEQSAGAVGGIFGQGEKEKLYDQGAAEFIDGYLRAMTGAAATKSEIDTYRAQWFPQFGDSAPVMQQKARGRLNALEGMKSKAGRAWNPTWDGMITDLRNQLGATSGQSANPMQMATEGGSQTVPGLNWDHANMGTREDAAPTMSQDEMDELQQLRAEFGVQ